MSEKTPGRAAHRAYWTTLLRGAEPTESYDDEEAEYQAAWDASADAACDAAVVHANLQLAAERDEARALVAELRAILLQGGQDAGDVRRSALAALDRAGMIGDGK